VQFAPKILDQFDVLEKIGEGGMGQVFRLREKVTGREFALKVMNQSASNDMRSVQRFDQEAHAVRKLIHANLVSVIDAAAPLNSSPYILMELIDGEDLACVISKRLALPPREALQYGVQICSALEHAHSKGVIHRDLKPSNVIITPSAKAKVVDFGISKLIDSRNMGFTATGASELIGSPFYMSPEQCSGKSMDARSDIYSFGCMLYELLSGDPPFSHSNLVQTLVAHLNEEPPMLTVANPDELRIPSLSAVIRKCLQKEPKNRYQTATDLSADLQRVLQGRGIKAARKFSFSGTLPKVGASFLIVALAGLLVWWTYGFLAPPKVYIPAAVLATEHANRLEDMERVDLDAKLMNSESQSASQIVSNVENAKDLTQELTFFENGKTYKRSFTYNGEDIADRFEAFLHQHPKMTSLKLENFVMTDDGYEAIRSVPKLNMLVLINCSFAGDHAIRAISTLSKLTDLQVNLCKSIAAGSLQYWESLPIQNLIFANTHMKQSDALSITKLRSLKRLDLTGSPIDGAALKTIVQGLPELDTLNLNSMMNLAPKDFGVVKSLKHLHYFSVRNDRQFGEQLPEITTIASLKRLDVSYSGVRDSDLPSLVKLPDLQGFIFAGTAISDAGLLQLAKVAPLKYVDWTASYVTRIGAGNLAHSRPDITFVDFAQLKLRSDQRQPLTP
jgi:hypothetical protein